MRRDKAQVEIMKLSNSLLLVICVLGHAAIGQPYARLVVSTAFQIDHDNLLIPAHAENHRSEASGKAHFKNADLLSVFPHMHLRGKSFRMKAKYPDGRQETILNVPQYDFNWQTTYRLKTPKRMPLGTRLHIIGHHREGH